MVVFVTLPVGAGHVGYFLNRYGRSHSRHLTETTYFDLARKGRALAAAYVFCDVQRMNRAQRALAVGLWRRLSAIGDSVRLYNDPRHELGRYEFLRAAFAEGWNRFNVYQVDEIPESVRWPVFLRIESDHSGPKSDLIETPERLWKSVAELVLAGARLKDLLVVEFLDTRSPDGCYRKYGAFRIGRRVFGQHFFLCTEWTAKASNRLRSESALAEGKNYFLTNPHAELLLPFFELAQIEYGRIDYALVDGTVQAWEINDNPQFVRAKPLRMGTEGKETIYLECLDELSQGLDPRTQFEFDALDGWEEAPWPEGVAPAGSEVAR